MLERVALVSDDENVHLEAPQTWGCGGGDNSLIYMCFNHEFIETLVLSYYYIKNLERFIHVVLYVLFSLWLSS